jgi:hypothetical protein
MPLSTVGLEPYNFYRICVVTGQPPLENFLTSIVTMGVNALSFLRHVK